MASRGSDLSTSMSAQDEDIENKSINDIALKYFKKYKVEISDAIRTTFPFLELLRDHEFITNEMYEDSQESFKKWCPVHQVIYNVLSELEKKFDMSLLGILFSKTIMKNYPDLFRIYKIFYKAIPDIEFLLKIDGEENEERPNDQLSLEQAPPEPGPLEHRHDTQEINETETDTTSDNEDALKNQQTNEQRAQESKTAGAELLHQGNQNTSCSVNPMGTKKEKSFLYSGVECEAQARTDRNQASEVIVINSQDFEEFIDEDEPPKGSTSALKRKPESMGSRKSPTSGQIPCKTGEELLHQGNQNTSCSVNPVDIKEEKPFLYSGVECEAKARNDCNQASDVIVIDSQDFAEFTDGDGPPEASTTALNREPESMDFRKSPTSGKILCKTGRSIEDSLGFCAEKKPLVTCSSAVRISEMSSRFSAQNKPPGDCTSSVSNPEVSSGFSAQNKPPGPCSSAVRNPDVPSGFSAQNKPPGPCSSAVRSPEVSSGFSAQKKPPVACTSAVRVFQVSSGLSAQNKPPGDCTSAVRVSQVSSAFSAQNKPPGACTSAVRIFIESSEFSAQNKPPGPCSSAVRSLEGSSGFGAQDKSPGACSSAVGSLEGSSGFGAQNKPPGACSSAVRSLEGSSGFGAQNKPPGACSFALRIGADEKGTVHLGKKSTLEKAKRKKSTVHLGKKSTLEKAERKKRSRKDKEENANFHSEILPVTCGKIEGMLYVKKFKQGTKRKCIRSQDGNWFNPKEFEEKAGYGTSKSCWKTHVRSNGKTLKSLMKKGRLPTPPVERDRSKKKCEFLLLMFYCHSESNGFQNIQHDNYRIENFQCMADFLMMDEIKKKLSERRYLNVMEFMQDVRHIFLVHRASKKCNNFCWGIRQEEKFELNFKQKVATGEDSGIYRCFSCFCTSKGTPGGWSCSSPGVLLPWPPGPPVPPCPLVLLPQVLMAEGLAFPFSPSPPFSTSMSAQDEDIENKRINDIALIYFKKYKVEISGAIKTTFPFLELLRDHEFITNEMYEVKRREEKQSLLEIVLVLTEGTGSVVPRWSWAKSTGDRLDLKRYLCHQLRGMLANCFPPFLPQASSRDLHQGLLVYYLPPYICWATYMQGPWAGVIPEIEFLLESDGEEIEERPNDQQSLEQDTPQPEHGPLELRHDTPEINATETDTTSDNKDVLKSQQSNEQRAQESKTAAINRKDFTEGDGPSKASTSALKRKTESIDFIKSPTSGKILCKTGSTVKCIRSQDGNWFTLQEFELKGGVKNANWKTSVRCNGRTLKWLMELENAEKCEICWEEGKFIYCCVCLKGFHADCHLPPVEPQRSPWRCTFCTIELSSRSQQQFYSESEVLARQMGPKDKSKCEFLLLKAYCHFEGNVFPNIPHENYACSKAIGTARPFWASTPGSLFSAAQECTSC
ncbi:Nuclear autoantigen Sp-100 [Myotis davidii]|uniref:Nuclear autoantigen Sp-100 n=1 Tax=Myotis davidii TaxID=225400 RepID=L5M1Q7_MYODS|nr:Nuclear autoantigen Sp-100 [Myotis davidii]